MNPALFAYLQNQQNSQAQLPQNPGGLQNNYVSPIQYNSGEIQPEVEETQEDNYNPFKEGTMSAMEAIRSSRQPSEDDHQRAFGRALMDFSTRMAQPTGQTGFGGTLAAINNSFQPAYNTYEKSIDQAVAERQAILQSLEEQKLREAMEQQKMSQFLMGIEEKKRQHDENLAYKREKEKGLEGYRHRSLEEQRRYHEGKLKNSSINSKENSDSEEKPLIVEDNIDLRNFNSFAKPHERKEYLKGRMDSSSNLSQLKNIKEKIEKLQKVSKDDIFNPADPYFSGVTNPVKDFVATRTGNKAGLDERNARKDLEAALLKARTEIEQRARKGPLTEGLARRFEKTGYLKLDNGFDVLKNQIQELINENEKIRKASDLSLKYQRHILPHDLHLHEEGGGAVEEKKDGNVHSNLISMKDPNTGQIVQIRPQDVERAKKQGAILVNG